MKRISLQSGWYIQRYAVFWLFSVLNEPKEADEPIHSSYDNHSYVQHTASPTKRLWSLHIVLQSDDDSNSFQREENCPEVKREAFDGRKGRSRSDWWQILEHIVEHEAQSDESEHISWRWENKLSLRTSWRDMFSSYPMMKMVPRLWDSGDN